MSLYRAKQEATALNPDRRFLLRHICFDKTIVRAQGHYLYDDAGTAYFDALSQYGALPFGHNPPRIWARIDEVRRNNEPSFVQPLFAPGAELLGKKLLGIAPAHMRFVVFVNSGAEACEAGIKLARARTRRRTILSLERGFHGKTLGALSATGNNLYKEPFLLDTTHFETLPFGDIDALARRLRERDVAAFIVESVQGEGGMRVQPEGYLAAASALCKETGTLLVLDEVQSGLGRSGYMFGFLREAGVAPDIILLAKALGGGLLPLGAVLCSADAWTEAFGLLHSSTFANNHLACAVGCAVIDELSADDFALIKAARAAGAYLGQRLHELVDRYPRAYTRATGVGLMQGLALRPWQSSNSYFTTHSSYLGYAAAMVAGYLLNEHKILTAPLFNQNRTLRLEPPLTVTRAEIDQLIDALAETGAVIERADYVKLFGYMVRHAGDGDAATEAQEPAAPAIVPPPARRRRGSFAFLIHPIDEPTLFDTLPPEFAQLDPQQRSSWQKWMRSWFSKMYEPAPVFHAEAVASKQGGYVEGWLIACPLTPAQMLRLNREARAELMQQYLAVARKLNVDIVGLGAFTSIISDGGREILDQGLRLTTGNSLTAVASVDSVLSVAARLERELAKTAVAVIGAAGSVGRLVALHCAAAAGKLILVGNGRNERALEALREVGGEIYARAIERCLHGGGAGIAAALATLDSAQLAELAHACGKSADEYKKLFQRVQSAFAAAEAPIQVTVDIEAALRRADIVVSASSAGRSFIDPAQFRPGTIVCDVARPLDVLNSVSNSRPDVLVYEGGVMHLPEPMSFGRQNVLGYPHGLNLACLSETIVLAMEGVERCFSIGNRIDYDEALWIAAHARAHGFRPYVPESLFAPSVAHTAAAKDDANRRIVAVPEALLQSPLDAYSLGKA